MPSLKKLVKKADPKNVVESITGKDTLAPRTVLELEPTVRMIGEHRGILKRSTRVQKAAPIVGGAVAAYFLGPEAGAATAGVIGGDVENIQAGQAVAAEEAERQRLAAEQARLEEESRAAMGGELLRRRRRRRESGLISSGFGSVTTGYKTVLGV